MTFVIHLITNLMLPKPPLPDVPLSFFEPARAKRSLTWIVAYSCEFAFDQHPPCGEFVVTLRQCPDAVQMVGQKNDSVESKRRSELTAPIDCLKRPALSPRHKILFRSEVTTVKKNVAPCVRERRYRMFFHFTHETLGMKNMPNLHLQLLRQRSMQIRPRKGKQLVWM
jgi:hypothetical protein